MADKTQEAAKRFIAAWTGKGYEKGESQPFWLSLLRDVYGVEHPEEYISFEQQVHLDHTSFIDGYIKNTRVMIEQKSLGKNLNQPIKQSDGSFLTPFQQAKRYVVDLPVDDHPRYIITCNFSEFWVYDMNKPCGEPEKILLKNLADEYYRLEFLVDKGNDHLQGELEVSVKAGEIVGLLYDAFAKQYADPASDRAMWSLNVLCVRLVFCLYAENAELFGHYGTFRNYLCEFDTRSMRKALIELFHILDTKIEDRDPYLKDDNPALAAFPYVNGGLFANEDIEIPPFTDEIRDLLVNKASKGFNWSKISPTIFGTVFESTLNPETRRSGGMHYTSIENIHKVIDPLFLNELKVELAGICGTGVEYIKKRKLIEFQRKLSKLTFLDPACGSGNFLTEAYLSLRRLENMALKERTQGQIDFADEYASPIMVSLGQFYGIEINDFAVSVARTALWIAEHQMMKETETIVQMHIEYLPLRSYTNIIEGNALRTDWQEIVPKDRLTYIMGNPPFSGARIMSEGQKQDINTIFPKWKNAGNLDYVCCWYKKATDLMQGTNIRAALVSTNSVSQGETVANLWQPLMEQYGVHIDFAHSPFRWNNEANNIAQVYCVIIGFSIAENNKPKTIYYDGRPHIVNNINGYLVDAENIFVSSRNKPLCRVPAIGIGNKPIDNGNYLFSLEEKNEFIKREPRSEQYFKL